MSDLGTFQKYKIILDELHTGREIDSYDEILRDRLDISEKQIGRMLKELHNTYDNIEEIEGKKRKTYKLIKPIDLFVEAFENAEEIGWVFHMLQDNDPEAFKKLEKLTKNKEHIYLFKNTPFEDLQSLEEKTNFKRLRRAVEAREYVKITFSNDNTIDNLKALKLVFIDNNWYVAIVDNENSLRLIRISFIKEVQYASNPHSYQPSSVEEHLDFLHNKLQNSLTRFDLPSKTAVLRAQSGVARYFKDGMKPFFSSQKFIKELDDGSVEFSVDYTQPLEILPFVQKWLPNITIVSPKELRDEYERELQIALQNCQKEK